MDFQDRIRIWKDTKEYCNQSTIRPSQTLKYTNNEIHPLPKRFMLTKLSVVNQDCIECGLEHKFHNPLVLNLADDTFPGGAVELGSGAQEESIFRRTNIHKSLNISFYPLKEDECLYTPEVHVLKNEDGTYKEHIDILSFISMAGIRIPPLISGHLNAQDYDRLKTKFHTILRVAFSHNHQTIIMGAIGCGAWKNPPDDVARCFMEVFREGEYDGCFREIVFAVLEVPNGSYMIRSHNRSKKTNYEIFKSIIRI